MKNNPSRIFPIVLVVTLATLTMIAPAIDAQTQKVLHTFTGNWDGSYPQGSLIFDSAGNLYGSTNAGGGVPICPGEGSGCGVVFELSPTSTGAWKETALFRFASSATGAAPQGSLLFDSAGNLYGLTPEGGGSSLCGGDVNGCGIAYELSPNSSGGSWTQSILEVFNEGPEGALPLAGFIADAAGNLYSTAGLSNFGGGNVFEISKTSSGWQFNVLYNFTAGADGGAPEANLVFDAAGNLYGTTVVGGNLAGCFGSGCGVVFELSPTASGTWTEKVLHAFSGGRDGGQPVGALIFDAAGNLYGTASNSAGTACFGGGCGLVFELSPTSTGAWTEKVLHTFTGAGDGAVPMAGVIRDSAGNLYGTTVAGGNLTGVCAGNGGCGVVFKLSPTSTGNWSETVLHRFSGGRDGSEPFSGLTFDASGNLYGSTYYGGAAGFGVIFETTP